jgi:Spy/CpxP family protein refolding chaperone
MKNWLRAIALTAISAAFLTAQPSPPSIADMVANQVAHLTKLLTLTTAQVAQATLIFTTEQTAISGLKTSQETAQAALKTAVQANSTSGIAAAAAQIGALETQTVTARATADAEFYAMLSSTQQTVYNELPGGGGPGFGPPGGPGGRGRGPGR